jgi:integrase/recombinase XerD
MSGWRSAARVHGPLAPFAEGYERWLVERGFRQEAVRKRLSQFADVSRWLESKGLSVEELSPRRVGEFLAARRVAGFVTLVASSSLRLPVEYLRGMGVVPAEVRLVGPVDWLLAEYRRYLVLERGLASRTIDGYESVARGFLNDRERRRGGLELERLSAADVSEFLARELPRYSIGGARRSSDAQDSALGGQQRVSSCRRGPGRRSPAASHGGDRDATSWGLSCGNRAGAPPPAAQDDGHLRAR